MASIKYLSCLWRRSMCQTLSKGHHVFPINRTYINKLVRTLVTHKPQTCPVDYEDLKHKRTSASLLVSSPLSHHCHHKLHGTVRNYSDSARNVNQTVTTKVSGDSTGAASNSSHGATTSKKLDVDEEMLRYDYEEFYEQPEDIEEVDDIAEPEPIKLARGKTGVFDIEDVVAIMEEENIRDVCVVKIPQELRYVDYMLIGTGRSTRHITAVAEYIRWAYKRKRINSDPESVKIEGELSKDWLAVDLGNIAVHLFLKRTREIYDLEQLWSCGPEHDEKTRSVVDDSCTAAFSFEEFSFDAELEKLRKIRQEQSADVPNKHST